MAKSSVAGLLTSVDEIFTTQEEREEAKLSKIVNMPLSLIDDFPGHPYYGGKPGDVYQQETLRKVYTWS